MGVTREFDMQLAHSLKNRTKRVINRSISTRKANTMLILAAHEGVGNWFFCMKASSLYFFETDAVLNMTYTRTLNVQVPAKNDHSTISNNFRYSIQA